MEGPFGEHSAEAEERVDVQHWPQDELENAHGHTQETFSEQDTIHSSHPCVWEDAPLLPDKTK